MENNLKDVIKIESFIEDKGYNKDKIKEIQDIEDLQKRFENLINYLIDYCKYLEKECKKYKELHEYNGENSEYLKIPITGISDVSDGYHTFNNLYHQRAVLFASIVNQNKDISWKSLRHEDGKYCFDSNGEWFIVGIDTPEGSYTYHYEYKYWDLFKCKVLKTAKHWDGHDENDVTRLLSL